jgi:hypothetical protein
MVLLCVSVALGQNVRGGRGNRGGSRGDRASANRAPSRVDSRTASFLRRVDTNGNGSIDADEVDGPHKAIVEGVLTRLGIKLKYPISLEKIAPAARNDRAESGSDDEGGASQGNSLSEKSSGATSANGFAKPKPSLPAVSGFGQPSNRSNGGEAKPAGSSKPRAAPPASKSAKARDASSVATPVKSDLPPELPKRSGPKSGRFLLPKERLPKDMPDWFLEKDTDGDGQVDMAEYASDWTPSTVAEFNRYDLNHDGVITPAECRKAAEGPRRKSKARSEAE